MLFRNRCTWRTCTHAHMVHTKTCINLTVFARICLGFHVIWLNLEKKLIMLIIKFKKSILHVTHLSTGQLQNLYRCHKTNGKTRTCACHKRPFSGFFRQDVQHCLIINQHLLRTVLYLITNFWKYYIDQDNCHKSMTLCKLLLLCESKTPVRWEWWSISHKLNKTSY